jgi:hypothetical protein
MILYSAAPSGNERIVRTVIELGRFRDIIVDDNIDYDTLLHLTTSAAN